jgi:hypothetical protein
MNQFNAERSPILAKRRRRGFMVQDEVAAEWPTKSDQVHNSINLSNIQSALPRFHRRASHP